MHRDAAPLLAAFLLAALVAAPACAADAPRVAVQACAHSFPSPRPGPGASEDQVRAWELQEELRRKFDCPRPASPPRTAEVPPGQKPGLLFQGSPRDAPLPLSVFRRDQPAAGTGAPAQTPAPEKRD